MVSSVSIDDDEGLVIKLKTSYDQTKEKDLTGTVKLREKGTSNYITLTVDLTVGYNQETIDIDVNGSAALSTGAVSNDALYTVKGTDATPFGTLFFDAVDAEIEVRVYDEEKFYLGFSSEPVRSILIANADSDAEITFLNFEGTPTFSSNAVVTFYGSDKGGAVYELRSGHLYRSKATWDEDADAFVLKTRTLGSYVIADQPLNNVSSGTAGGSTGGNNSSNPDTGLCTAADIACTLTATAAVTAAAVSIARGV